MSKQESLPSFVNSDKWAQISRKTFSRDCHMSSRAEESSDNFFRMIEKQVITIFPSATSYLVLIFTHYLVNILHFSNRLLTQKMCLFIVQERVILKRVTMLMFIRNFQPCVTSLNWTSCFDLFLFDDYCNFYCLMFFFFFKFNIFPISTSRSISIFVSRILQYQVHKAFPFT